MVRSSGEGSGAAPDASEREYDVCVVTHPLTNASEPAIHGLLDLIAAVASVSLVTANLPEDSGIRSEYEVVEVARAGTGASIPVAAARFLRNQLRMARAVRRRDEEVVLFFGAVSYVLPILAAKLAGKAVVVEPRGDVPESLYQIWRERVPDPLAYACSRPVWLLERVGYRLGDAVVALSPTMADELDLRAYEHKLHEHGARPVDVERFAPEGPFEDRPRRVGYLGRLDEEKGVDVLIDVVRELPEDVEFVFVGDGALRPEIESALADRIDAGTVTVTGWIDHDDVPAHLADLRLLVSTSPTEGVPTTALEAMACGTPVASFPVGGVPDVIDDGETGLLLRDRDPAAVAAAVEDLLDRPEDLAATSDAARAFVVEEYGFETVAARYERIFASVTA